MADQTEKRAQDMHEQAKAATREIAHSAADAVQKGSAAAESTARGTAEIATRQAGRGAETLRHLGEITGDGSARAGEMLSDIQQDFLSAVAEHFDSAFRTVNQAMRDTAEEWRALATLPNLDGSGFQEAQRSALDAAGNMMRTNIRVAQQVFRAASPAAFAGMQQQFARDYLHALLEGSAGIMRGLQQTAQQALRPLEQRISHLNEIRARQEECRRVADVMARQVRVVSPDDTVQQVARTMREADTGVLPVGDGEKLVGMVTDRDVTVRLVAEGKDPSRTRVRDVMSPDVRYVFEDEDLEHVAQNMAQQQVRRLPVMNRQKRLVGVVSLGDIAKGRQPAMAGQALSGIARPSGQHTQAAAE